MRRSFKFKLAVMVRVAAAVEDFAVAADLILAPLRLSMAVEALLSTAAVSAEVLPSMAAA